jgi:hypothetical protein
MPNIIHKLLDHLPIQFRVLCRQFPSAVVDLEALSIQVDIPKFLEQFADVLIMLSLIRGLGFLASANNPTITRMGFLTLALRTEQRLISIMMLVAGLVAVISWMLLFPTGETSW